MSNAEQLIADILEEYAEDDTKAACDACEQCGPFVMCSFHSVLSLLAGRTWTRQRLDREGRK